MPDKYVFTSWDFIWGFIVTGGVFGRIVSSKRENHRLHVNTYRFHLIKPLLNIEGNIVF